MKDDTKAAIIAATAALLGLGVVFLLTKRTVLTTDLHMGDCFVLWTTAGPLPTTWKVLNIVAGEYQVLGVAGPGEGQGFVWDAAYLAQFKGWEIVACPAPPPY